MDTLNSVEKNVIINIDIWIITGDQAGRDSGGGIPGQGGSAVVAFLDSSSPLWLLYNTAVEKS